MCLLSLSHTRRLRAYVRYLAADEDDFRLRDFFNDLVGPPSGALKNGRKWEATILVRKEGSTTGRVE